MNHVSNQQASALGATRTVDPIWRLAVKRVSPIVTLNEGDARLPIYWVHPISGDVVGLRGIATLMGTRCCYGIQVPRDRMNGRFAASIEGMASHYVALLCAFQPEGAMILAGWSAGAIVALEMARQLRRLGREVPLLVALDGAPCNTGAGLRPWHPLYMLKLLINVPCWMRDDVEQDWSPIGIWKRINFKMAARFGIGSTGQDGPGLESVETMDAAPVRGVLDAKGWNVDQTAFIHAMYRATIDYIAAPYDGRVIVYETKTQPLYHLRQIGAAWRKIARLTEVVRLEGNHSGIIREPSIGIIARHLLLRLAELA